MMQRSRRARLSNKGFTLIELIIVIVIIGLLAMMAIPQMMGFTREAEKSTCQANQKTIYAAAQMYAASNREKDSVEISELISEDLLTASASNCPSGNGGYKVTLNKGTVSEVKCLEDDDHGQYPAASSSTTGD